MSTKSRRRDSSIKSNWKRHVKLQDERRGDSDASHEPTASDLGAIERLNLSDSFMLEEGERGQRKQQEPDADENRQEAAGHEYLRQEKKRILIQLYYNDLAGEKPWIDNPESVPDSVKAPGARLDEYGVHDSFYDYSKNYERLRRFVADNMRRAEPGREAYMLKAIEVVHERSKAETVEAFIDEVCRRLARAKVSIVRGERNETIAITRAEVESYVMTYLWTVLGLARAEIDRERKKHESTREKLDAALAELKREVTRRKDRERKQLRKN